MSTVRQIENRRRYIIRYFIIRQAENNKPSIDRLRTIDSVA